LDHTTLCVVIVRERGRSSTPRRLCWSERPRPT